MSRVLPALWSYTKNEIGGWRMWLAVKLVPSWYDQFCELNRLRTENKALLRDQSSDGSHVSEPKVHAIDLSLSDSELSLARIRGMSERSEDRDFKEAFDRLLLVDESTDGSFLEEPSKWETASQIMDGSR